MGQKQLARWHLMKLVVAGRLTLWAAAQRLALSYRQAKRLKAAVLRLGPRGVIHGNRGRASPRRLNPALCKRIVQLSRSVYENFNDCHFQEMLAEREGIRVSRVLVRRLRRQAGIGPKRRRRPRRHHKRRPRKPCRGLMMLWDGSPHPWLGSQHPPCCLMAALDDATGELLAAFFCRFESSAAYLQLLRQLIPTHGIPLSVYQDRHSTLKRNDPYWSLEEELAGQQHPTQVGQALAALGIEPIFALTPQAKGRIERLFGVLQDRLIAELGLQGLQSLEQANLWLARVFLPRYNHRFARPPLHSASAFRPAGSTDLDRILSLCYRATVGNDNAVRLGGHIIDIPAGPARRGYAGLRVEVRQLLNGSWRVYHHNRIIATAPPTSLQEPIRTLRRRKSRPPSATPPVAEPWVYLASRPATSHPELQTPQGDIFT